MPGLYDLAVQLQGYAAGTLTREELDAWCAPVLAADPLGAEDGEDGEWAEAPDEERLYWRLLYLVETSAGGDEAAEAGTRALVGRVLGCLAATGSAADTLELLPLLADQPRLCAIVERHARGVVTRTGFLNVLANAGYPPHARLWLERAGGGALAELCARLGAGEYAVVARLLERAPAVRHEG
jgi:hypothetical protein